MSVLIVGSMAFDSIETPCDKREKVIGGSCTYASIAASFFIKPSIVGVVGDDFTDTHFKILEDRGIDTSGVVKEPGKSFFWSGKYHEDMNTRDTLVTELNVFEKFDPVIPPEHKSLPYLFLANIDPPLQLKVLNAVEKPKFTLCDTMNLWIDIKKNELTEVFKKVDCVVLNDEEIKQFTGKTNLLQGAKEIQKLGPEYVIIKKGEHGAAIIGKQGFYFAMPSFPVENVVDPTGAGDSFAGAFIGFIAKTGNTEPETLKKALVYGNAVASYTVEGFSIEKLEHINENKIKERVNYIKDISSF